MQHRHDDKITDAEIHRVLRPCLGQPARIRPALEAITTRVEARYARQPGDYRIPGRVGRIAGCVAALLIGAGILMHAPRAEAAAAEAICKEAK